jgi:hypothetical protein
MQSPQVSTEAQIKLFKANERVKITTQNFEEAKVLGIEAVKKNERASKRI